MKPSEAKGASSPSAAEEIAQAAAARTHAEDIADRAVNSVLAIALAARNIRDIMVQGHSVPGDHYFEALAEAVDRAADDVERLVANVQRRAQRWDCGLLGWEERA